MSEDITDVILPDVILPVSSTVVVEGNITVRTYSDGAVQRNVWETAERAQEYANSVTEQEGA